MEVKKNFNNLLIVLLCVTIDQLIKFIIFIKFMDIKTDILGDYIVFYPIINPKLSYGAYFISCFNNPFFIGVIIILCMFAYITGYRFYCKQYAREKSKFIAKLIYTLGLSGMSCSIIDKVFWKGSLDYISIKYFFVFDIKDCYFSTSVILFLVLYYKNKIDIKEYFIYLKSIINRSE
jgi:signal peptidase II